MRIINEDFVREKLPFIGEAFSKSDRGRLLMAVGSFGMAGAAVLSAGAALRTGVGYLVMLLPENIYPLVTAAVPEAVCRIYDPGDPESFSRLFSEEQVRADAVVSGCGLGGLAQSVTRFIAENREKPWLLDADSLNALAVFRAQGNSGGPGEASVLTPHEGEAARLLFDPEALRLPRESRAEFLKQKESWIREHREEALALLTERFGGTVLLKGPDTLIGSPGAEPMRNPFRNPGLGRAGSGDTLSGIIGSLMAQGLSCRDAAAAGAFIHGRAGELARGRFGVRSMLPSDVIRGIPEVLKALEGAG